MTEQLIARRYAQALFMLEEKPKEQTLKERSQFLLGFEQALAKNPLLLKLFSTPILTSSEKQGLLLRLFEGVPVDQTMKSFLLLLAEKRRLALIPKIASCFATLLNKAENIDEGQVVTAVELDEKKQKDLTKQLEEQIHKRLLLTFKTDPDILGGLILQVGDKELDVSIRNQLTLLKEAIKRNE